MWWNRHKASYSPNDDLLAAHTCAIGANLYAHDYDDIGNHVLFSDNLATNTFTHNALNQMVGRDAPIAPPTTFAYTPDGGLSSDGTWEYAYDAEDQLLSVTSADLTNGAIRVLNAYDHRNRRIRKTVQRLSVTVAPPPSPPVETREWQTVATHTFVWDGNNIVLERIARADGTTHVCEYFWGMDKSGTEQGAGGVEGLLAVSVDGVFYIPCYDHNGNIVRYVSETGTIAAQYTYDPYGNIIESSGLLADVFSFGFSTKYHDCVTGMICYQERVYIPVLGRWLNRDPIEEDGGENLYNFVVNSPSLFFDFGGMHTFQFTDKGWSYANVLSGELTNTSGIPIKEAIGATSYSVSTGSKCVCSDGKYVPDYTFKVEVYSLIQNMDDKIWDNDVYGDKINDPRVKGNWNSFWFFEERRRRNLVIEHEERHRMHARKNYDTIVQALSVSEQYDLKSVCERQAHERVKAAELLFKNLDDADAARVERGNL